MGGKMAGISMPWLLAVCTILTVTSQTAFAASGRTAKEAVIIRAETFKRVLAGRNAVNKP
jgi:hypothetical protein